ATFTIVLTNNGPGSANNVAINDPLPNGATLTWSTASAGCTVTGSGAAQTLSCTVGTLAQGASFSAAVSATTAVGNCPPSFPNLATATASNAASVNDAGSLVCQQPVLVIAKTPDGGTITAGGTASFTIVLTNNGPGPANNVAINDPLPNGAT